MVVITFRRNLFHPLKQTLLLHPQLFESLGKFQTYNLFR